MTTDKTDTPHATCVAWGEKGVLIMGKSGQGKSGLALELMAMGCVLVADDRVKLKAVDGRLLASCPETLAGLIEARGVGILQAAFQAQADVVLAVDLNQQETARMPERRVVTHLGCDVPLIYRYDGPHFAAAILQILKTGWSNR